MSLTSALRADLEASTAPPSATTQPATDTASTESGSWARPLPDLIADLTRTSDEPALISGFVLSGLITLLHGQPRDWKTLVALHVTIAVATGRALFGLARLSVPVARSVLYLTEEDGARRVTDRLRMICAGLGCAPPANLFVAAGSGFSLDDPESHARLIAFVRAHNIALVILDPLRSLSGCVDQGPKELRPLTLTLRALMRETGCTIFAVHHDSKPLAVGVDGRRRPQRASGGAVFSIADSPIGIDALPDGRRLLAPTAWKFSEDPPSILLAIASGDGWLHLVGEDADGAVTAGQADLGARVLAYVATNPRTSGRAIAAAVKARAVDVKGALERLAGIGKIDSSKVGKARRWFVIDEKGRDAYPDAYNSPVSDGVSMRPDAGRIPVIASVSMRPDVGTHADACKETLPDTTLRPEYASRPYKGRIPGTHAESEALSDGHTQPDPASVGRGILLSPTLEPAAAELVLVNPLTTPPAKAAFVFDPKGAFGPGRAHRRGGA